MQNFIILKQFLQSCKTRFLAYLSNILVMLHLNQCVKEIGMIVKLLVAWIHFNTNL